jgi:L-ribulose-5-phosphate 3-epimerase UlaE
MNEEKGMKYNNENLLHRGRFSQHLSQSCQIAYSARLVLAVETK